MTKFTIDAENSITAFTTKQEAEGAQGENFSTQQELTDLAATWPAKHLGLLAGNDIAEGAGVGGQVQGRWQGADRSREKARRGIGGDPALPSSQASECVGSFDRRTETHGSKEAQSVI